MPGSFGRGITEFGQRLNEQGQPTGETHETDLHLYFAQIAIHRFIVQPLG